MGVLEVEAEAGLTATGFTSTATDGVSRDSSADGAEKVDVSVGAAMLAGRGST